MQKRIMTGVSAATLVLSMLCLLLAVSVNPVNALVEEGVTENPVPPGYGFIDFEEGIDGEVILSTIPGVEFTTTMGLDWLYADIRTGYYNVYPYGHQGYECHGYFFAWLGTSGDQGIITFTMGTASYFSVLTSTYSGLTIDAYDSDGNFLATSGWADDNLWTRTFTRLTIEAEGMAYVIIHDTGNYWLIDDLVTDAPGVPRQEIPVHVDIKPGSWPNPINVGSKGVFAVAICGIEDFDVMTIDPATVKIYIEGNGEGVSPLRWSYEDVATPWTGEPGGGHALRGDGFMDLVLHFDTQAVVNILTLTGEIGQTVPLIIRGTLYEEFDGTAIQGQDYVRIQAPR